MRICLAVTYYKPYLSGLSVYAERLAEGFKKAGHEVSVLAAQYPRNLPEREITKTGIQIFRAPVYWQIGKAALQFGLMWHAYRRFKSTDVVQLHLPMGEAGLLAILASLLGKRILTTYHCDLALSPPLSWLVTLSHRIAVRLSERIFVNTEAMVDSPTLTGLDDKMRFVFPPVPIPTVHEHIAQDFKSRLGLQDSPVVGFIGRFSHEKGIEVLLDAFARVRSILPRARLLLAGPQQGVVGENIWPVIADRITDLGNAVQVLGYLEEEELGAFYSLCDVIALPSRNTTESFGMVQVEAMLCGTPVVASDLPGVREPIRRTGMGRLVECNDVEALASAILDVIARSGSFHTSNIASIFSPTRSVESYLNEIDSPAELRANPERKYRREYQNRRDRVP